MNLVLAMRTVRWSVQHRGVGGTVRAMLGAVRRRGQTDAVHPFDREFGTETGGVIGGGRLGVGSVHDVHITAYAGVVPSRLQAALDRWAESLGAGERVADFTFLDLGCGKGRAVLLASLRPFRGCEGVELNPGLVEVAARNVSLWRAAGRGAAPVRVAVGDATEVRYPEGKLLVFIYNSFGVPVMEAVLEALDAHVAATGCRVDLLFQNESEAMPMRLDSRLVQVWTGRLPLSGEDAAAETVASPEDVTSLYRWRRSAAMAE